MKVKTRLAAVDCQLDRTNVRWRLNLLAASQKWPILFNTSGSRGVVCRLVLGPLIQEDFEPKSASEGSEIAGIAQSKFPLHLTLPRRLLVRNGQITGYPIDSDELPHLGELSITVVNSMAVRQTGGRELLLIATDTGSLVVYDVDRLLEEPVEYKTRLSAWGLDAHPSLNVLALGTNAHRVCLFFGPGNVGEKDRSALQNWVSDSSGESAVTGKRRGLYEYEFMTYFAFSGMEHAPLLPSPTDAFDDNLILVHRSHTHNVPHVSFSACGTYLVSVSIDGSISLFNLETKRTLVHRLPLSFYNSSFYRSGTGAANWQLLQLASESRHFLWCAKVVELSRLPALPHRASLVSGDVSLSELKGEEQQPLKDERGSRLECILVAGAQDLFLFDLSSQTILECMLFQPLLCAGDEELSRIAFLEYIPDLRVAIIASQAGTVGFVQIEFAEPVTESQDMHSVQATEELHATTCDVESRSKKLANDTEKGSGIVQLVDNVYIRKPARFIFNLLQKLKPHPSLMLAGMALKEWRTNYSLLPPSIDEEKLARAAIGSEQTTRVHVLYLYLYYENGLVKPLLVYL